MTPQRAPQNGVSDYITFSGRPEAQKLIIEILFYLNGIAKHVRVKPAKHTQYFHKFLPPCSHLTKSVNNTLHSQQY